MAIATFNSELAKSAEYSYAEERLDVELTDGKRYRYYGVPSTVWRGLRKADSKGGYLSRNIMRGQYRKRQLASK